MGTLKSEAMEALVDDDYGLAVDLFTKALKADSTDCELFLGRAAAYIKQENYIGAASDSKRAIALKPDNHRAYFRQGEAAFNLEEYETALEAFKNALEKGGSEAKCKTWIRKCQAEIEDEGVEQISTRQTNGGSSNGALASNSSSRVTGSDVPASAPKPESAPVGNGHHSTDHLNGGAISPTTETVKTAPEPKYRHQFFQTQNIVEVAVMAKNTTAERVKVDIQEDSLSVVILDASGDQEYALKVKLFGTVDPASSTFELLRSKIAVRLTKQPVIQWSSLEATSGTATAPSGKTWQPPTDLAPAYPTSFKRRPVDWDKLEADLKKEEKDEKLEGDAALQKLFQGIYANADEDTKRAMNKSFQESNGTVLSTNWKDIGSKKTVYEPADSKSLD